MDGNVIKTVADYINEMLHDPDSTARVYGSLELGQHCVSIDGTENVNNELRQGIAIQLARFATNKDGERATFLRLPEADGCTECSIETSADVVVRRSVRFDIDRDVDVLRYDIMLDNPSKQ